jgi:hypothetical protein
MRRLRKARKFCFTQVKQPLLDFESIFSPANKSFGDYKIPAPPVNLPAGHLYEARESGLAANGQVGNTAQRTARGVLDRQSHGPWKRDSSPL